MSRAPKSAWNVSHQRQDLSFSEARPALLSSGSPLGFFRPAGARQRRSRHGRSDHQSRRPPGHGRAGGHRIAPHEAEVEADQASLRERRDELERLLAAAPSADWAEAVEKTRYLLSLFAETSAAADPRRQALMNSLLADFDRLLSKTS
jgi:hypothetical protein